jgi:GH24 family phage-related lysozyme (muramidase)
MKVIIEDGKDLYEKISECKLNKNSNIREGFSNTSAKYNNTTTPKDTILEVDLTTQQKVDQYTRVKVLKIDTTDVSSADYTVITDVLSDKKEIFKTLSEKSVKKELLSKDIKIEKDSTDEKYLLYSDDSNKYIKYSDCKESHPISFDWATIIDESSSDDISIFENIRKYLLPDYIEGELKINPLYKELFKLIDKDSNGQIDAKELEEAAKDKTIKKLTSNYIVKHSTEWDKSINLPNSIKAILEEYKGNIKNYYNIKDHLENEEKRVKNLAFFDKCKSVSDFPSSDKVFHINPIGLVGEFENKCGQDCKTIDFMLSNGKYYKVSEKTMKFILSYEGFKSKPYVPKDVNGNILGTSGITIGYGYDLGQQTSKQVEKDLDGFYTLEEIKKFQSVAGLKQNNAVNNLSKVQNLTITKDTAMQLTRRVKANYAQKTYDIWPEVIDMHPHCQGALLSIVYNRGNSLNGDRRKEMKNIQIYLSNNDSSKIPTEIIAMKRLWNINIEKGLHLRRDEEAKYFKKGLRCEC